MKRFYISVSVLVIFLLLNATAYSFETAALRGKTFDMFIVSTGDIDDYCSAYKPKTDKIAFSEDTFEIDSLKGGIGGIVDSTFSESMFFFDGNYTKTFLLDSRYKFDLSGINLADTMIIGTVNIRYYEFELFKVDYVLQQEADGFFIGIRN